MKILLSILFFLIVAQSNAATYYFSTTDGNDSRTAAQAQNPSTPWQTISKLNSFFSSLAAGDNVLFKRGDTFFGAIISNKNGTLANKITLGAYGSGAQPIISGLVSVTSWTNLGSGIYESNALPTSSMVNVVVINGVQYAMGRTPNANASNGGYLNFESHTGSSITDNTNPFTSAVNGATLVVRTVHPLIDQLTITSVVGNTINYSGSTEGSLTNGYGYFVENSPTVLDQYGEWYFNTTTHKIRVYFGASAPATTQVATQNILMELENSYLVVDNLHLVGANRYGIYGTNSGVVNLTVNHCTIEFSGIDGISLANRVDFVMDSTTVNYSNSCGLSVGYQNQNPIVTYCNFTNIATFNGMFFKDDRQRYGFGIYSNEGLTATHNVFTNMGAIGINCEGSNNLMQYNFVDTFCTLLDDGGGLYMYNHNPGSGAPVVFNNQILDNIVLHGIGEPYGTASPNYIPAEGIYLDNNVTNVTVARNTVAYCADFGIYLHNDSAYTMRSNVLFNNGASQIGFQRDATNPSYVFTNGRVARNQLFSTTDSKILYLASPQNNMLNFATFDSNYYCRPFDTSNIIQTVWFNNATNNYHLSNWKTASGQDAHTVQTPVPVANTSNILFLYNETTANKNISLTGSWLSVTGTAYSSSITLTPYTSVILLSTSSNDTIIVTTPYPCDSTVTTTLPQRIILVGYDTIHVSDTTFTNKLIYGYYTNAEGGDDFIFPVYDTIDAHDTTYVCSLCGTCYRTDTIVNPAPETVWNGMLPNYSAVATLTQRIAYVKSYNCDTYRNSFDTSNNFWNTTQIKASGLNVFMTYNTAPVQPPTSPLPTPATLAFNLHQLDSTLNAHSTSLPDFISFQNEEPNFNYWSGLPIDYINWLKGATTIAHNYGIPATNGGIIMNVIYYVRYIFQQEGKTDSVNYINQRGLLPPAAFPQAVIDWYKVEIPLLASTGIDYVNLHWYEPIFGLKQQHPNSDTTTGLLPLVINFLRSRIGLPVLTNEFGSGNGSQALFNQTADEWNDNGVKIRVYYAGQDATGSPGAVSELHPEFWSDWILAHP